MNPNKKNSGVIETDCPEHKSTAPSSARTGPTTGAPHARLSQKIRRFLKHLPALTGAALALGATSCVVPYDSTGGSVTVSSYQPGYAVTSLPGGYRSEMISGRNYYYHNGSYYRQDSGRYVVVQAPRNSRYRDDYTRRQQSYQPGRNRQSSNRDDSRNDRNEIITRLPQGYRTVNHGGSVYYQSGNQYYRRQGNAYRMTARPY